MKNYFSIFLLLLMILTSSKGFTQTFYKDYVKYRDAKSKPRPYVSKAKLHSINVEVASELKRLFDNVEIKRGLRMLNYDTLFFFESVVSYYSGAYSKLIWAGNQSCYYENPYFSPVYAYPKKQIVIKTDAREDLLKLGPDLKSIIQKSDTSGFRQYVRSDDSPKFGDLVEFMVATKTGKNWHFFSSKWIALFNPD